MAMLELLEKSALQAEARSESGQRLATVAVEPVESASATVGRHLKPGATVIYESTVYPGATEEVCVPILRLSVGKACGCGGCNGREDADLSPCRRR
jgi:UDP-N-acetyl-D-mannosaminuronate dehydrogenase